MFFSPIFCAVRELIAGLVVVERNELARSTRQVRLHVIDMYIFMAMWESHTVLGTFYVLDDLTGTIPEGVEFVSILGIATDPNSVTRTVGVVRMGLVKLGTQLSMRGIELVGQECPHGGHVLEPGLTVGGTVETAISGNVTWANGISSKDDAVRGVWLEDTRTGVDKVSGPEEGIDPLNWSWEVKKDLTEHLDDQAYGGFCAAVALGSINDGHVLLNTEQVTKAFEKFTGNEGVII